MRNVLAATLSVAAVLQCRAARADPPPRLPDPPAGGLYVGLGGGGSPDAGGPSTLGGVSLDRPIGSWFGFLINVDVGALWLPGDAHLHHGSENEGGADLLLRIAFGPRAEVFASRSGAVRLRVALLFVHAHEAPASVWGDDFFGCLFGESQGGLGHRSGVGHELQLSWNPWLDAHGFARRVRTVLRAGIDWIPHSHGPKVLTDAQLAMGIAL